MVGSTTARGGEHEAWQQCQEQRAFIEEKLHARVRLSKVRRLTLPQGVDISYSTLHRYAAVALGFDRRTTTVPVIVYAGARRSASAQAGGR